MQTVFGEERHRYRKCGLRKFSQANNRSSLSASYISSARFWIYSHCVLLEEKKRKRENSISSKPQYSVVCGFAETPHPFHGMVPGKFQIISSWPVWVCGHPKRSNEEIALFAMTAQPEVGTGKANCVSNRILPPLPTWPWGLNQEGPKPKRREPSQVESHIRGYISTAVVSSSSSQSKVF